MQTHQKCKTIAHAYNNMYKFLTKNVKIQKKTAAIRSCDDTTPSSIIYACHEISNKVT